MPSFPVLKVFKSERWSGQSRPLLEDAKFEVSSELCFGHVHGAAAHCQEGEKPGAAEPRGVWGASRRAGQREEHPHLCK